MQAHPGDGKAASAGLRALAEGTSAVGCMPAWSAQPDVFHGEARERKNGCMRAFAMVASFGSAVPPVLRRSRRVLERNCPASRSTCATAAAHAPSSRELMPSSAHGRPLIAPSSAKTDFCSQRCTGQGDVIKQPAAALQPEQAFLHQKTRPSTRGEHPCIEANLF